MTTQLYSNPSANCCPPNTCEFAVPIHLKVPIYINIETLATSQPAPPQVIVVPIQPDLQLTPKVESRQPECVPVNGCS